MGGTLGEWHMTTRTVAVRALTGRALDWAVSVALGGEVKVTTRQELISRLDPVEDADLIEWHQCRKTPRLWLVAAHSPVPLYSTRWECGGPLLDANRIDTHSIEPSGTDPFWIGQKYLNSTEKITEPGDTMLIAGLRCLVTFKLGKAVEVPEGLLQ